MILNLKVQKAFSSSSPYFYHRQDLVKKIKMFLSSKTEFILNLTGNPGCGKTSLINFVCQKYNSVFLNSYVDDVKKRILTEKNVQIWIVDEFDKFKEHQFIFNHIKTHRKKLITLCNSFDKNQKYEGLHLHIKPYSCKEIENVLRDKCKEVGHAVLSEQDIKIVASKFSRSGDMRLVFDFVHNNFDKTEQKVILANKLEKREKPDEDNFHHKLIKEVINECNGRRQAYRIYIEKCIDVGLPYFFRNDFYSVFDLYNT